MLNKIFLCGRLTKDVDIKDANGTMVGKYTLAVDRKYSKGEEKQTDFINCVAFGKTAEFAEKYLSKGKKILVVGRLQTGSYTDKDGRKVYTTDVIVDEHEFVESKGNESAAPADGEFMKVDESQMSLPF